MSPKRAITSVFNSIYLLVFRQSIGLVSIAIVLATVAGVYQYFAAAELKPTGKVDQIMSVVVALSLAVGGLGAVSALADKTFIQRGPYRKSFLKPKREIPKGPYDDYGDLAKSSRALAASLYDRSGVYLITGVLLAVGGIATFYFMRPQTGGADSVVSLVVALLPGSSMLLLVELIAFFFLRQSRAIMDEFRHFDHLARYREEVFAAMRLSAQADKPLDISELIAKGFYFTRSERLGTGESTEIIEVRKLEKTEIDLLNKVVEVVASKAKP
jgi:hypothetical protein